MPSEYDIAGRLDWNSTTSADYEYTYPAYVGYARIAPMDLSFVSRFLFRVNYLL